MVVCFVFVFFFLFLFSVLGTEPISVFILTHKTMGTPGNGMRIEKSRPAVLPHIYDVSMMRS